MAALGTSTVQYSTTHHRQDSGLASPGGHDVARAVPRHAAQQLAVVRVVAVPGTALQRVHCQQDLLRGRRL